MLFDNVFIPAAFIVAGLSASFRVQFQALMYLMAVIYAVDDINEFMVVTLLYVVVLLFHRARIGASGKG